VIAQLAARLEAEVEDLGEAPPPGQGDEAVAHVSRGRDAELLAQPPTGSAVVGNAQDGGEAFADRLA
jgi:hypothetical protein